MNQSILGIQSTRKSAKHTIMNLIRVHEQTIRDILGGKKFWRDGEEITHKIHERCLVEIRQCQIVHEAIGQMSAGNIRKAADLCSQIQEHIANVH